MSLPKRSLNLLIIILMWAAASAHAAGADPLTYDRISLSVTVEEEVEPDLLVAVLAAQREGPDAAVLAGEVNALVDWALNQAKGQAQVDSETLGYTTNPVYTKGALSAWRVRQSIRLRSGDSAALSGLVGGLQERLLLQSIGYEVSDGLRNEAEDRLIRAGIDAFKARAQLIADQMGQRRHRLVEMQVETQQDYPAPVFRAMSPMASADAAPTPPRVEAGKQTVRVQIPGVIELQVQ